MYTINLLHIITHDRPHILPHATDIQLNARIMKQPYENSDIFITLNEAPKYQTQHIYVHRANKPKKKSRRRRSKRYLQSQAHACRHNYLLVDVRRLSRCVARGRTTDPKRADADAPGSVEMHTRAALDRLSRENVCAFTGQYMSRTRAHVRALSPPAHLNILLLRRFNGWTSSGARLRTGQRFLRFYGSPLRQIVSMGT